MNTYLISTALATLGLASSSATAATDVEVMDKLNLTEVAVKAAHNLNVSSDFMHGDFVLASRSKRPASLYAGDGSSSMTSVRSIIIT